MKIKQLQETTAGAVASVAMPIGQTHKRTEEAANPAQQAAIAVAMKKAGKKPKNIKESDEGYTEINPKSFLDDDFYAFDPDTKVLKGTWSHKSVGRRHHEYDAQQKGYVVVSGMKAKHLGLRKKSKVDEGGFDIPEIPRAPQPKPTPSKTNEYMDIDKGATSPKTPIEKPVDKKPYEEPKDKKDPKTYMDKAMTKESSIFKGVSEAHISEEELLLAPGQGIKFKTDLLPKRTDHEVEMARNQLRVAAQSAKSIYQNIKDLSEIQGLDGWVQAKITKASDYLDAVNNYIEGKKQMLEIQDEVDEQVDDLDQRISAQYNTPQALAKTKTLDQLAASGTQADYDRLGVMSPQQIERDYQAMLAAEPAQDAAVYANPKLTPSARRPVQRYNPKGVPIKEFDDRSPYDSYVQSRSTLTNRDGDENYSKRIASLSTDKSGNQRVRALDTSRDFGDEVTINTNIPKGVTAKIVPQQGDANIEETKRLSTREKFKRSLKRAGYDPDAGADRLLNLIARQAEERKEFEKQQAEKDAEFYGKQKGVAEGLFGISDKIKGKIQYITSELSDIPGYWDHKNQTFTEEGLDSLKRALKRPEFIKYALNLTADDYDADLEEDWQKTNRRDKTSGMSRKAVKQYRRENPGSKLQTAVTTKPSKLKKGSKSAKRRKSFCSRMRGMKKSRTSAKTARDPNSNINKALRRWNCESVEEMRNLVLLAEQKIAMMREEENLDENLHKWFKEKWVRFGPDGKIRGDCARGDDSEGKPKCLPQSKAQSLGKKGRASAAARKRREDPNPERSGKAINVATKKKSNEGVAEGSGDAKYKIKSIGKDSKGDYYISPNTGKKVYKQAKVGDHETPSGEHKPKVSMPYKEGVAEGSDEGLSKYSTERLQAYVKKVSGGGVPAFGSGAKLKRVEAELKRREQALKEMDKSAPQPGRDGRVSHSTYGSRDKGGETGKQIDVKPVKANKVKQDALKDLNKAFDKNVKEGHEMCPECGGAMYSEEMINEKKDACYYKVKSRYKVWPSAYASGALVKCRNKGAKNWGNKSK